MKKQAKTKKEKREYKNEIPIEIRILFGKFYVFSILLSIFLGVGYQFILDKISFISSLLLLIVVLVFYIYMFIDLIKHKKNFMSSVVVFCLLFFFSSLGFAIYKFILQL